MWPSLTLPIESEWSEDRGYGAGLQESSRWYHDAGHFLGPDSRLRTIISLTPSLCAEYEAA